MKAWQIWCLSWIKAFSRVIEAGTLVRVVHTYAAEINAILQESIPNHILVGDFGHEHNLVDGLDEPIDSD